MSRERFCRECKKWHEVEAWPEECFPKQKASQSPTLQTPQFISDTMNPVQSQLDGQMYDSKAALRSTYKAAGVVELGNDSSITAPKPRPKTKVDRAQVRDTVDKALTQAGFGA